MGSSKFTEPGSGSTMAADKKSGAAIFQYRDAPFDSWADIAYKAVATPGTAEAAASTAAIKGLWLVASPFNTGVVACGPSSSTKATATLAAFRGLPVYPGQAVWLPVSDPALVYVDNLTGDKWAIVYPTHTDS